MPGWVIGQIRLNNLLKIKGGVGDWNYQVSAVVAFVLHLIYL